MAGHQWFLEHRGRLLTDAAIVVTTSGSGVPAYLLAAAAGALAVRRGGREQPEWWPVSWWQGAGGAAVALAAGQLVRAGLAAAIGRPRPPRADWAWHAGGPALPSGHATTSGLVAALGLLALAGAGRRVRTVGTAGILAWAGAVGLTRVYLGVHWPTDVVAGWLLAATLALVVRALLERSARPLRQPRGGPPGASAGAVGGGP